MVSGWIQSLWYGVTIRAGDPKPAPGSPKYQKHRRRVQSSVIVVYLLYCIYETDYWIRKHGDFFQVLGIPLDADEKKIKSKFRRLAAVQHPDKVASDNPAAISAAEAQFVLLKSAQDTLTDPVKRFAYLRFGPDINQWQQCTTIRDYVVRGVQTSAGPLWLGGIVFLIILALTGYLQRGKYWRFVMFAGLVLLEGHIMTRPYDNAILESFINPILTRFVRHAPLLPFQLIQLARKSIFAFFIAMSQIGNLQPQQASTATASGSLPDLQQLARLESLVQNTDTEASRLLAMESAPFIGDEQGTKDLSSKVREWLVTNTVHADPEVRDAMGRAMQKRRIGAPAGAKH